MATLGKDQQLPEYNAHGYLRIHEGYRINKAFGTWSHFLRVYLFTHDFTLLSGKGLIIYLLPLLPLFNQQRWCASFIFSLYDYLKGLYNSHIFRFDFEI